MRYAAHQRFIEPARPTKEPWRLIAGLLLLMVLFLALNWGLDAVIALLGGRELSTALTRLTQDQSGPGFALASLFRLGFLGVACILTVRTLHRRGGRSLFGDTKRALGQGGRVLVALALLYAAIAVLPPWGSDLQPEPNLPFGLWLSLLPLSLVAIIVQSGAEELVFRGYLQQQLAARFASPLIWAALPTALFAALHYAPALAGENAGLVALWAAAFGIAAADLTARAGTLGPAIAFHAFNNATALLLLGVAGNFDGLALYVLPVEMTDTAAIPALMLVDLCILFVGWLAARLAIRA
ncbi:hypothetical protein SAMN05421688_2553 [Poseidonocella pacifica]|uniref:CAAX prenyl protease 2/Lysostaphin resistance protein A-like domain-containing protein n=2 Tax=Poseidonocella pacifica TaxID=871651 RepID=A0A1I0XWI8_9RHOB|nr:hypothetical protein SAMN05421688_2553 [Poseidonocella pacifica]